MYRSMLANRRVLVVLDDAGSESQVHQLLPGSPTCGVVVTSRTRLTGLAGSHLVDVDFMDSDDALELLGRIIGTQRLQSEPVAAAALVDVVGGLPLALRIIGARLAARPHWTLASMVGRLADERHRLDELVHGDMVVRASLSLTYDGLEPDTCRVMRLMSLLEAESLPAWTASALTDDERHRGFDLLERLVDAQLLDVVGSDVTGLPRYRFHDLIRLFAKEQLAVHESPATQLASVERVAGGWLAIAEQAHQRLYGGDFTVLHGNGRRWQPHAPYLDQVLQDPLGWLESERPNICAAVLQAADAGLDELCWDLAMTLVTLFETRSYLDEWQHDARTSAGGDAQGGQQARHRGVAVLAGIAAPEPEADGVDPRVAGTRSGAVPGGGRPARPRAGPPHARHAGVQRGPPGARLEDLRAVAGRFQTGRRRRRSGVRGVAARPAVTRPR